MSGAGWCPAVVFLDLDGCLVDSTGPITESLNHALRALGVPPRPSGELVRFIGPPLAEAIATLLAEAGGTGSPGVDDVSQARIDAGVDAYRARYAEVALRDTTLIPGIVDALADLTEVAPLVLVTSKPERFARPIVEQLGLDRWLTAVHGPSLGRRIEPKRVTLARALADVVTGIEPARTVMVGDRAQDVLAGRACGTRTVGVTWGAGSRQELQDAGADRIVDDPAELVALLSPARSGDRTNRPVGRDGRADRDPMAAPTRTR